MILTGPKIAQEVKKKNIVIEPYNTELENFNSYDFRLGDTLKVYKDLLLDPKIANSTETITIPSEGIILQPDKLYLGYTMETIGSKKYVPIIRGKSSTGRLGLFVNITADLIDIGYVGKITLMLHAVQPVRIFSGMKVGQVTFWKTFGKVNYYNGKYQGSSEAEASKAYKDFL